MKNTHKKRSPGHSEGPSLLFKQAVKCHYLLEDAAVDTVFQAVLIVTRSRRRCLGCR